MTVLTETQRRDRIVENLAIHESGVVVLSIPRLGLGPWKTNRDLFDVLDRPCWDAVLLFGQNVWLSDEVWREVGRIRNRLLYMPVGFPGRDSLLRLVYYATVQRHLIENSDSIIAMTDEEIRFLLSFANPESLARIPAGIDWARMHRAYGIPVRDQYSIPDGPFFINVGGDYRNKRLREACLGVDRFNQFSDTKVHLVLIGVGTEPYSNSWVHGLGVIPEEDKVELYHEASLLLNASNFEGFGIVLLEALASGIPFVSTDVGGARELATLGGGSIIWQNPKSSTLRESIAYHLWNEFTTERFSGDLSKIAQAYDWSSSIAPKFEEVMR